MIRHRPFGSGHAYADEPDRRAPAIPLADTPFTVGCTMASHVDTVSVEWETDGTRQTIALTKDAPATKATSGGTHLAAAAAGAGKRARVAWRAELPGLAWGTDCRYRFVGDGGRTRWFPVRAARWQSTQDITVLGAAGKRLIGATSEVLHDGERAHRVRFRLRLEPGERVVGFGERFDAVDQRGQSLDSVVFEQYKGQGAAGRTYLPMPWATIIGADGQAWGFHLRTSRRTWFDIGQSTSDAILVEAASGPDGELVVAGYQGTPAEVLSAFLDEAGRPEKVPDWVYRLWMSGNEWNTQASVLREAERHRSEDIPVGVLVIEAWSDESTFTAFRDARYPVHSDGSPHRLADFDFPPDGAWPDPAGMVKDLHERDIKVLLWQIPLQKMRPHPTGQAAADAAVMVERGYGIAESDGRPYRNRGWWFPLALMPDFTNPEARDWWLSKRRYLVEEVGIDGFKTDGGEHAWGHDLRYADGTRGDESNNRYPMLYAQAYQQLLRDAGKPPVTFSRAGFTGTQALPAVWAGDEDSTWEAYRSSVIAGITAGASGIVHWGWDLAGFSGDVPTAELYLRATAMACFAPIMQYHSEYNHHRIPSRDRTPWNVAERTGDKRCLTVFRRYAHVRERLVPYLADQAVRGLDAGKPLMRALYFDDPSDPEIWNWPLQYRLGDDLLVAPVTEPNVTTTSVYLPAGDWVDVWTGTVYTGLQTIERDTGVDEIPVYCRAERWSALKSVFA